ncbi:DUF3618 domain-containing protein [Streptomyces naganishii]|uniref:Alanine-rich protein n=1 Tax=Streptomyces naganishii JCM 4654 TaxID=1306179 RepID=A0A918Y011_9ACTN|nr:DUF3618 domain-containing protein [Streptomyces naganishii]GHD84429.1 alanine-rich protein [Streptomyces naganishii JCM 4654]
MTDRTQGADGGSARATGAKGPDELRQQIEQTRSRLGDTVEELAAKADVKGRAKARAADLRDKAGAMTVQLRSSAVHAGHRAQEKASQAGHRAQEKASHAGHGVQDRVAQAGHTVEHSVPHSVNDAVAVCRRNPRSLMIAGAAGAVLVTAGVLLLRRGRQSRLC